MGGKKNDAGEELIQAGFSRKKKIKKRENLFSSGGDFH